MGSKQKKKVYEPQVLYETYKDLAKMAKEGNAQAKEALKLIDRATSNGNIFIDKTADIVDAKGILKTDEITRISNSLVSSHTDPMDAQSIIKGLREHSDKRYSPLLSDNIDYLKRSADNSFETIADSMYSPARRAALPANYTSMMMSEKYPMGCFYKDKIWWEKTYGKDERYKAMFEHDYSHKPKYPGAADKLREGLDWLKGKISFGGSVDDLSIHSFNAQGSLGEHLTDHAVGTFDFATGHTLPQLDDYANHIHDNLSELTNADHLDITDFHFDFSDLADSIKDVVKDILGGIF